METAARTIGEKPAARPALADLFREHFDSIFRFFVRLGARSADAEDLSQEVFLTAQRRLASFEVGRSPRPWLFGIAYNLFREHRRRAQHHRESLPGDVDSEDRQSTPPQERALDTNDARALVRAAVQAIPERQRAVFVLHELDGMSMPEVAETLDLPLRTAYARLEKARHEFSRHARRLQSPERSAKS